MDYGLPKTAAVLVRGVVGGRSAARRRWPLSGGCHDFRRGNPRSGARRRCPSYGTDPAEDGDERPWI